MNIRSPKLDVAAPLVLLTGFNAFGGDLINPSWLAAQTLHGVNIEGHQIIAAQLPTQFDASRQSLAALLRQYKPALVLCLGVAAGRPGLSLERVAINVQDARIPDNVGSQPIDVPVVESGPAAYFSSLPIKSMLQALTSAGISVEVSQTAGTFVCNHVFYWLMHQLKNNRKIPQTRGGFIHVPNLPEQGSPSMSLDEIVRGLRVAITVALTSGRDASIGAGALS